MGRGGAINDDRQRLLKLKIALESGTYEVDLDGVAMSIMIRLLENALEWRVRLDPPLKRRVKADKYKR